MLISRCAAAYRIESPSVVALNSLHQETIPPKLVGGGEEEKQEEREEMLV